jgi:2-polyprenyl-6-methoxyphenol hydroxylase-like FAD-dependent oxidoreductase
MKIGIIGAGIAGLTTAIALNKKGFKAVVFEAAPEIKAVGAGLGLAANAIKAFEKIGIADEVIKEGKCLSAFNIFDQEGKLITSADSTEISKKYGLDNFTIHRGNLHKVLLKNFDPKRIFTSKRSVKLELKETSVAVHFEDNTQESFDYLIIADGIHSPLRKSLIPGAKIRYSGYTCWRAVIDNPGLDLDAASETWGEDGRFGIVPLANNKIYWFACKNAPEKSLEMKGFKIKDIQKVFENFHSPIPEILSNTTDDQLLWNDISDLKPISKYAFGRAVLIGDAGHATTPNMGQGACQAIEDAVVLAEEVAANPENLEKAFLSFEKKRLKRTHWIVNNSNAIGKVAQLENRALITLRNIIFRNLPKSLNEKQIEKLYKVNF